MPNDDDDMSARADRSAVGPRGPIDTHLLYPSTESLSVHTFLLESHRAEPLRRYREDLLDIHTADVIARIRAGDPSWRSSVPPPTVEIIERRSLFGYPATALEVKISDGPIRSVDRRAMRGT